LNGIIFAGKHIDTTVENHVENVENSNFHKPKNGLTDIYKPIYLDLLFIFT